MKNSLTVAVVAFLAAALSSAPAAAQSQQQGQQQGQQQQQQQQQQQSEYQSAEKFKDMSIKSPQGQEVGTVDDVIVDMKTGQIAYFTLSRGGIGGMGQEKFIVPFNAMTPDPNGNALVMQVPREKLRLAPPGDDVEKQITREMGQEIADHYGLAPYWESSGGGAQQQQQQQPQSSSPQPSPAQPSQPGQPQPQSPQ